MPGPAALVARQPVDVTPPPAVTGLRVVLVTQTRVDLEWDPVTDDYTLAGYTVYLDGVVWGETSTPGASLTDLEPGRSYLVEVDAVDAAGNRSPRAGVVVETLPLDVTPPSAPGGVSVVAAGPYRVTVDWLPATDDVGVFAYGVYLDGEHVEDVPAGPYTVTGLTPETSYRVGVDAVDAAGNRSPLLEVVATTTVDLPPTPPVNVVLTEVTRTTATIAWGPGSDDDLVAGYRVRLDGAVIESLWPAPGYTFTGLEAGSTHTCEITTVDSGGQESTPAVLVFTTAPDMPPTPPPGLRQTGATYTSITVEWDPASDDVGVSGYDVHLDGTLVQADHPGLAFTFTELAEGTTYQVAVRAVDDIGQRGEPAVIEASTLDDTNPEPVPVEVEAGETTITLRWGESSDDFGVVAYRILLNGVVVHEPPLDGVEWTIDGPVVRTHTIRGLAPGLTYRVGVQVEDTIGQTTTTEVEVQTRPVPFTPIEWPVYRVGDWAGNTVDAHGVTWVVEQVEGWQSSPPVRVAMADADGIDGGVAGAGLYGPRTITLEGRAVAPTRLAMLAAKQRLARVLHPADVGVLRVEALHRILQARVRLAEEITIADEGELVFSYRLVLTAPDPRRYSPDPVTGVAVLDQPPGQATLTLTLDGTYPQVPARLRLFGPIRNWVITHQETGQSLRAAPGVSLPADPAYSVLIDLGARTVTRHTPEGATPGRALLAHLPAWFQLVPGVNTFTLSGEYAGEPGAARLIVEAHPAV
ncbi:fibronectin type III domain-containing protein [Thermobispora bispora]|uniref:fibronectin type III domain-containing protein n=1 Tax=Thermobispora bispora TaxID=2006 RepID=UPI00197DC131|nr:fibronectin type III domain-containing protein [Thermobispora bispora]